MMVRAGFTAPLDGKKLAVHDVEVVHLVGPAVHVQRGRLRVSAEPDRPVLMGDAGERDALAEEEAPREEPLVALVAVDRAAGLLLHEVLQLADEPACAPSSLFGW